MVIVAVTRLLDCGFDSQSGRSSRHSPITAGRFIILLVLPVLDFIKVINGSRVPAAGHPILSHSSQYHALTEALLKAAVLASITLRFRNLTIAFGHASVNSFILHRPLKETLASFASDDAVMEASGFIFANHANHWGIVFFIGHWTAVGLLCVLMLVVDLVVVLLLLSRRRRRSRNRWSSRRLVMMSMMIVHLLLMLSQMMSGCSGSQAVGADNNRPSRRTERIVERLRVWTLLLFRFPEAFH